MRILLVEDDIGIAKPLAEYLRHQNHIIDIATDGMEGWEYARSANYDLVVLDWMLPKLDGIALCKRLRAAQSHVLILMLTGRHTTLDRVAGLDSGADDYLVKPCELEELAARIRALSRRITEIKSPILRHGDLQLNPSSCTVTYAGNDLSLTPKEYMILEYFLRNPTQVLTRSAILKQLWSFDKTSGEATVKTHMTNLRNKLKAAGIPENFIETVYGIGYRLSEP